MKPASSLDHPEIESIMDKEVDVKVCDICGDAGQEDLLAICSRCIDGAQHTYCMQTMLDKLPVGDWLCEDCKFKEVYENQKAHKFHTVTKVQEESCLNEDAKNASSTIYSEILLKKDSGVVNLEDMVVCRRPRIPEVYNVDINLNIHTCERIKNPVPREIPVSQEVLLSSPEDSLINRDSSTVKPSNPEKSCGSWSVLGQKTHTSSGSISSAVRDSSKVVSGPLLKPNSFKNVNAKPKVKQLHGAIPLAENAFGKNASKSTRKGGLSREMVKFASFETEKGGCNGFELDNEKSSVDIIQIEGVERDKELGVIERTNCSKVQVADTRICRGLVDGDNSGCNRENLLHSSRSSASASSNGLDLEYQNRFQVSQGFRSHVNVTSEYRKRGYDLVKNDPVSQHDNHLNLEFSHQDDIIKVVTSSTTLNKPMYSSDRTLYCQKCNEAGHPTHLCSFDRQHVSAKLSVDGMSRENAKSNKWKASIDIILSKQEEFKNTTIKDQSKELPVPSFGSCAKVVNKEGQPHCFRKRYFQEGRTNVTRSFVFDKGEPIVHPHKIHHKAGAGRLNPFDNNISEVFEMKSSEQIFPTLEPYLPNILKASVIPKLEFFWQGGFEVVSSGRLPECCDGLQAHFSSYASGIVFEAANKFPVNKVQLEEVPCLSSWPHQFHGNHAKEHNIALFFFAKDIESYRSSYCKLLDNMLKYDLALKGNFGGFELLIFPSYKLPENSQRWNRLFFLWGIFKARRSCSIEMLSNVQGDPCNSTMDVKSLVEDLPIDVPEASNFKRKDL